MDRRHTSKWISTPSTALEGLEGQHISWMESQTDIVIFAPHLIGYETTIGVRWLAHPNHSCGDFPRNFWSSHKYHVHCQSEEFYESLNDYTIPPLSPNNYVECCVCVCVSRAINKLWACSPISMYHVLIWCPFLYWHPPLQYMRTFQIGHQIRQIYLVRATQLSQSLH